VSGRALCIALLACSMAGCDVGHDRTPSGCRNLTVLSSRYDSRTQTIIMILSNRSVYGSDADPGMEYSSWPDTHIGPYGKGEEMIVCPDNRGRFDIRNTIVGTGIRSFRLITQTKQVRSAR